MTDEITNSLQFQLDWTKREMEFEEEHGRKISIGLHTRFDSAGPEWMQGDFERLHTGVMGMLTCDARIKEGFELDKDDRFDPEVLGNAYMLWPAPITRICKQVIVSGDTGGHLGDVWEVSLKADLAPEARSDADLFAAFDRQTTSVSLSPELMAELCPEGIEIWTCTVRDNANTWLPR